MSIDETAPTDAAAMDRLLADLAEKIGGHSSEGEALIAFSQMQFPPRLLIPPGGLALSDLGEFVSSVLSGDGSSGASPEHGGIHDQIPADFLKVDDIYLVAFEIDLSGGLAAAPFVVGFEIDERWVLPTGGAELPGSGELAVERPGLSISNTGAGLQVAVHGTLDILGVEVAGSVSYPSLIVDAALVARDEGYTLGPLLHELGLDGTSLDRLTIDELFVSAGVRDKLYSFGISSSHPWKPVDSIDVELTDFSVQLGYDAGDASANISATLTFEHAQLEIDLDAEYAGGDLTLSGSTPAGTTVKLGTVMHDLAAFFGVDVHIPAVVDGLTFSNIEVSFNSTTKDFSLSGRAGFPGTAAGDPVLTFSVELEHQDDKRYTKRFSGSLEIEGLHFVVKFAATTDSTTFAASYHDDTGQSIAVDDIIYGASKIQVNTGLKFTIRDAVFAYLKAGGDSRYLLGIDIDAGLNLSALKLPNLPLVSNVFPPDQTLTLAFQVLYPTGPFTSDEAAVIDTLLTGGLQLPEAGLETLVLAAGLRTGDQLRRLQLPIALGSGDKGSAKTTTDPATDQPAPAGNGLVSTADVPAGSSSADVVAADGTQWIKLQKSFGPLHVERVGLKYQSGEITGLLDAALSVGPMTMSLIGLSMSSPLAELHPTFGLHGLGLDYHNGPVEIGGAFLKTDDGFAGIAVLKTEALSLSAMGAYSSVNGHTSLFVYALLNYPLGGPPFFFVTGLAAGFGYNRRFNVPTIDQVASFPLVAEASSPPAEPPPGGSGERLAAELAKLGQYLPPAEGENFLAVGVKFTSFEQVDSFALIIVKFGGRFEIDVLGTSTLTVPATEPGAEPKDPLAIAKLAVRATLVPSEGFLGVQAQLTPESFAFSRDCHLVGGFAFYSWFSGQHAGDFVLSLGGYHPDFHRPTHYPKVDRIGFNWQVNDQLSLKATGYFALTGHMLMAGGSLDALWESGSLSAKFVATADFLVSWQPYHYDARIAIELTASVTIHFFGTHHISIGAGADLHIWGPEFTGTANVHVSVMGITVSFDVSFGGHSTLPEAITWSAFVASFLPDPDSVASVAILSGLLSTAGTGSDERWIINPKEFALATNSTIPITQAALTHASSGDHPEREHPILEADQARGMAINPMGIQHHEMLTSHHHIHITRDDNEVPDAVFSARPIYKAMPAGLWGEPHVVREHPDDVAARKKFLDQPSVNGERLVPGTVCGFEMVPAKLPEPDHTVPIPRRRLRYETEPRPAAFGWTGVETVGPFGEAAWQSAAETIVGHPSRAAVLQALGIDATHISFSRPILQDVLARSDLRRV